MNSMVTTMRAATAVMYPARAAEYSAITKQSIGERPSTCESGKNPMLSSRIAAATGTGQRWRRARASQQRKISARPTTAAPHPCSATKNSTPTSPSSTTPAS